MTRQTATILAAEWATWKALRAARRKGKGSKVRALRRKLRIARTLTMEA